MDVRQGFLSMSELYQKVSRHSGFSSSVDKGGKYQNVHVSENLHMLDAKLRIGIHCS